MFRVRNKNIYLNRGDAITLQLVNIEKEFTVEETSNFAEIKLTSAETRIGDAFKDGSVTYWYEIELNGDTTLIGYDDEGAKKFVLYPEATTE